MENQKPIWKKVLSFLGWHGVLVVLFFSFFMIFLMQNIEPVRMSFLWWRFIEYPKLYFILLFFALGFLSGILVTLRFKKSSGKVEKF
jgi:uncharacterized integral membrane protein